MKLQTFATFFLFALVASLGPAHAQTFSVIHTFTGPEGAVPLAGLTLRGNSLYGTAYFGGNNDNGTAYQITRVGSSWSTAAIYLFNGSNGAYNPQSRVTFGPDGHLYGVALQTANVYGSIFRLTPPTTICRAANCFWKIEYLHRFANQYLEGIDPMGDLVWDQQGNIYGTTQGGGRQGLGSKGTVYELTPSGNGWRFIQLYSFSGVEGSYPSSGVILDSTGNLFGTAQKGGANQSGNVFELTYSQQAGWVGTSIYDFKGTEFGATPSAGLIMDASGNLYGAAVGNDDSWGNAFELSPSGNTWQFKDLHDFRAGCGPSASLAMDAVGNLYGTTACDGIYRKGTVFKLTNSQNGWQYTTLHDFTGGDDGSAAFSNVTIDVDGTLYGTASRGGSQGWGTVWMIKP